MYLTEENSDVQLRPPCLKNWTASVRGMIHITGKLFENFGNFPSRCFNQDPVEIFFSCIRSYGIRNTNPTCTAFASSCKALLLYKTFCRTCLFYSACDKMVSYITRIINNYFVSHRSCHNKIYT
jgi:hypothetical protein